MWGNPDNIDMTALMNPQWAKWFDAVKTSAGGKQIKMAGGKSVKGSNQFRGTNTQTSGLGIDRRDNPLGPQGFMGASGASDDMFAIRDDQQARPSLTAMQQYYKMGPR